MQPPGSAHSAPDKNKAGEGEQNYEGSPYGGLQIDEEDSPMRSVTLTVEEVNDAGSHLVRL